MAVCLSRGPIFSMCGECDAILGKLARFQMFFLFCKKFFSLLRDYFGSLLSEINNFSGYKDNCEGTR